MDTVASRILHSGNAEDYQKNPSSFYKVDSPQGPVILRSAKIRISLRGRSRAIKSLSASDARGPDRGFENHREPLRRRPLRYGHAATERHFRENLAAVLARRKASRAGILDRGSCRCTQSDPARRSILGHEQRLLDLGFSFVYDKGLYDAVRDENIGDVRSRLSAPAELSIASRAIFGKS